MTKYSQKEFFNQLLMEQHIQATERELPERHKTIGLVRVVIQEVPESVLLKQSSLFGLITEKLYQI
jgi:hypothetical protein